MNKLHWVGLAALVSLVSMAISGACAPATTPIPVQPSGPRPQATPLAVPTLSPEEGAWAKTVTAAKKEGTLMIYDGAAWGAAGPLEIGKAFSDTYGIKVEFVSGMGADILERLKTERRVGNMIADIYTSSTVHLLNAKKEGFTSGLSDLMVLREEGVWVVRPDLVDPTEKHLLAIYTSSYPSWVNTKLVKSAEEPQSYQDVLSPRWKGQLIVIDPKVNSSLYIAIVPLLKRGIVSTEFIKALGKQSPRLEGSSSRGALALSRGDGALVLAGSSASFNSFVKEGAPIKPVALAEGTIIQLAVAIAVVNEAQHPNAGKLFVNWLLSKQGQELNARVRATQSMRQDVEDHTPGAGRVLHKKTVIATNDEVDEAARMFMERGFPQLWEK